MSGREEGVAESLVAQQNMTLHPLALSGPGPVADVFRSDAQRRQTESLLLESFGADFVSFVELVTLGSAQLPASETEPTDGSGFLNHNSKRAGQFLSGFSVSKRPRQK